MNRSIWLGAVMTTVLVLGGLVYLRYGQQEPVVQESGHAAVESSATLPASQPLAPPADTIPTVESAASTASAGTDIDKAVQRDLEALFGGALKSWLFPEHIINCIVATIDSLDGDPVALRLRPLRYVEGLPVVDTAQDGSVSLSPDNARRYDPYVEVFSRVDAKAVADFYFRHQAAFQKAHAELGYREQSFNDRLLGTIDHLLAAPDVAPPVKLRRPNVLYEFDDPKLERLSSGQKIMIRIGSRNAAAVKAKLREIRAALVAAR